MLQSLGTGGCDIHFYEILYHPSSKTCSFFDNVYCIFGESVCGNGQAYAFSCQGRTGGFPHFSRKKKQTPEGACPDRSSYPTFP